MSQISTLKRKTLSLILNSYIEFIIVISRGVIVYMVHMITIMKMAAIRGSDT